jgi:dihydroorotate dehydrogenase
LWGGEVAGKQLVVNFSDGSQPINLCSPIVLAAGANKNGKGINNYANLGLGGITIGTATRNFRIGNTNRPRVGLDEFNRLIYNSMGLNNDGIEKISARVERQIGRACKNKFAVGISVAESPGIPENNRLQDLLETFSIAYKTADYLEINVSCPNTGEERLDLDTAFMKKAFFEIEDFRKKSNCRKAVYAKLSPDLTDKQLLSLLDLLTQFGVNGVILGNTYPSEKLFYSLPILNAKGTSGGISGRPIYENTFRKTVLAKKYFPKVSVVACGGIDHGLKVMDLLNEGADFVQVYSVFAFRWMAAQKMNFELDLE